MDVTAIRSTNLQALVADLTRGGRNKRDAALALGMSGSYLSQLLGGKPMGNDVARKIEEAARLGHGWMDREHAATGVRDGTPPTYQVLRMDPETIAAAISLVRHTFALLELEHDNEDDGTPLAFAYEYLMERQEQQVTPDNLIDFSKRLAQKLRGNDENAAQGGNDRGIGGSDRRPRERREAG
ncbi:hypothetical protein [Luteimonas notoginsengisoli]|uniref:XRE family transcriptional regulator n=1 Tax=Luteimonas notoginsengisoli TaxID=1578200 RepID=A0ABV7UQ02_9GAMM